jgi:hypothetical protein
VFPREHERGDATEGQGGHREDLRRAVRLVFSWLCFFLRNFLRGLLRNRVYCGLLLLTRAHHLAVDLLLLLLVAFQVLFEQGIDLRVLVYYVLGLAQRACLFNRNRRALVVLQLFVDQGHAVVRLVVAGVCQQHLLRELDRQIVLLRVVVAQTI